MQEFLQGVLLVVYVFAAVLQIALLVERSKYTPIIWLLLVLSIHAAVYYSGIILHNMAGISNEGMMNWSAILRLHSAVTMLVIAVMIKTSLWTKLIEKGNDK